MNSHYHEFNFEEIYTWHHGKCLKLESSNEIKVSQRVQLEFKLLTSDTNQEATFYLFSNSSWHGLCDDTLPFFHPSKVTLKDLKKPKRIQIKLSLTEYQYMNGNKDFSSCFGQIIQKINCPSLCVPFYIYSMTKLPLKLCDTLELQQCMNYQMYLNQSNAEQIYACQKPKSAKLYNPRQNEWDRYFDEQSILLNFFFESNSVLRKEEIYVIGITDFIGSVGGILGLFLGFSIYAFLSQLTEMLFQICD